MADTACLGYSSEFRVPTCCPAGLLTAACTEPRLVSPVLPAEFGITCTLLTLSTSCLRALREARPPRRLWSWPRQLTLPNGTITFRV